MALQASTMVLDQIRNGAPFQMYLSADEDYVLKLHADGLTLDQGTLYAIGRIVIIAPPNSALSVDGELKGFTICGADKKFVWGKAEILPDNTVAVSHPDIKKPTAVRFGWANFPVVNLWNKDGLPASPFRTDEPKK